MKIRLIAVDMDGTCIDSRHRVPQKNLQALGEALRAGIFVVPATGRTVQSCPPAVLRLKGIRYFISSNGARVSDVKRGLTIRQALMPCQAVREFVQGLRGYGVWIAVHKDDKVWDNNRIPYLHRKWIDAGDPAGSALAVHLDSWLAGQTGGVEKIQVFFLTEKGRRRTAELLKRYPDFSCACSHKYYVEITAAEASKGQALKALCDQLQIDAKEVMAIGDSDNDRSMFDYADYPVAMGNASKEIKKMAADITETNDLCGVAVAVQNVLRDTKSAKRKDVGTFIPLKSRNHENSHKKSPKSG